MFLDPLVNCFIKVVGAWTTKTFKKAAQPTVSALCWDEINCNRLFFMLASFIHSPKTEAPPNSNSGVFLASWRSSIWLSTFTLFLDQIFVIASCDIYASHEENTFFFSLLGIFETQLLRWILNHQPSEVQAARLFSQWLNPGLCTGQPLWANPCTPALC